MNPAPSADSVRYESDLLEERIARLTTGPADPDRDFIISRYKYRDLYGLAEAIRREVIEENAALCLCTENKALVAAALMAALTEGFSVILPFTDTVSAVEEIGRTIPLSAVLSDRTTGFPKKRKVLTPVPYTGKLTERIPAVGLDDPVLKFFTGGSTGKPRMWSKTPRNLFAEAFFHAQKYRITLEDRILATVPPYHIYGFLYSVLIPLVSSASVIEAIPTYPEEIRNCLVQQAPTIFASVPVHYRVLNGTDIPGASLRHAVSSAGKLDGADADYFIRTAGVELIEIYGSTETGGIADRCRSQSETALTPFEVVDWKIMNERLCVRSAFISPEIETSPDGYFMTGDRAAPEEKNRFRLLGRADGIIKVGGNRVDLDAIRDVLKGIDGVEDAVVISFPSAAGRENDIFTAVQGDVTADRIQESISTRLEPQAWPRRIKIVPRLPVSSSGKYDRAAIEALFREN